MILCSGPSAPCPKCCEHEGEEARLTGFMEDFGRLLLNSFPAALEFVLRVLQLHHPDLSVLDGFFQLLVQVLQKHPDRLGYFLIIL